jgi:hypothetical protein
MKIKIGISLPIFFVFCSTLTGFAQRHEVGGGIAAFSYVGEVQPVFNPLRSGPGGYLYYRFNPSAAFSLRPTFSYGVFSADDSDRSSQAAELRQYRFQTSVFTAALHGEYHFLNFIYKDQRDRGTYTPYFAFGLGFTNASISDTLGDASNDLFGQPVVPLGVGIKVKSKTININAEFVMHKTFTDGLDGIAKEYTNADGYLLSNPNNTDWYYYFGLTFSYTFHKVICYDQK